MNAPDKVILVSALQAELNRQFDLGVMTTFVGADGRAMLSYPITHPSPRPVIDVERLAEAALAAVGEATEEKRGKFIAVKALEWRNGYRDETVTIFQASFGGMYQVRILEGGIWLDWPDRAADQFPTIEAAKANAQSDFDQRVRFCLTFADGTSQ